MGDGVDRISENWLSGRSHACNIASIYSQYIKVPQNLNPHGCFIANLRIRDKGRSRSKRVGFHQVVLELYLTQKLDYNEMRALI